MPTLEEISRFAKVPLNVEVELDRRTMSVRDILELKIGSVVTMKKAAGENFEVLVGGTSIGSAEVVIVENSVAVRMTSFEGRN